MWASILIRATDKYTTPPEVIHVGNSTISTLGNFSASTGKGKSKKTFNVCAIVASAITGRKILNYEAHFPEGKRRILYFDTEQSSYHCHKVLERINRLAGYPAEEDLSLIEFVMLREYNPIDRRQIIELALAERPDVGLVIIDGLRDLLFDINSSVEAAEVIGLLMRWTSQYNLHIHTVLHLNKADDNVRGHIGTELNHKAETILQVRINANDWNISEVHPSFIRDKPFSQFAFRINEEGIPEIAEDVEYTQPGKIDQVDYRTLSEATHRQALDNAFDVSDLNPDPDPLTYSPLLSKMIEAYAKAGFSRQLGVHKNLLKHLVQKGVIVYRDRKYYYNRNFHYVPDVNPESVQFGQEGI